MVFSLTASGSGLLGPGRAARRGWLAEAIDGRLTPEERRTPAAALPLLHRLAETPHDSNPSGDAPR
ncbi:hypothetical protein [Streptomyces sp. NPDC020983]|uniref:hypothetical protein n=1 Tax=Streptomyces sp. NPDC020983 TaxID=3365106 RepID=UPI0037B65817